MNEHALHPATTPPPKRRRFALAGFLALAAAFGPAPAGATRPPPAALCAPLDPASLCYTERILGFGEAGANGFSRGGMALAGARGRSRGPGPRRGARRKGRRRQAGVAAPT